MNSVLLFLLVMLLIALAAGPLYMRMLAHGAKPDAWWRGRRDGGLVVGVTLLIGGAVVSLIGGGGALGLAWLLLVSAVFNLSIAGYCHLALRHLASRGDGA